MYLSSMYVVHLLSKYFIPGDGEDLDNELLLMELILWGVACWVNELRRGAKGVAVGVVEADEAAELLRLWLYRIGEAVARGNVLHLGDMAEKIKDFLVLSSTETLLILNVVAVDLGVLCSVFRIRMKLT